MTTPGVKQRKLAGRTAEFDRIDHILGGSRSLLLVGAAGVGRSSLLRAALDLAAGKGFEVVRVGVVRSRPARYITTLDEWLSCHISDHGNSKSHDLKSLHRERPRALGIDDLDRLDPSSAAALYHLVEIHDVRLIGTVRAGSATAEAINRLWLDGLAERIEVHPLDRAATSDLLHERLGGTVSPGSVDRLWFVTHGNPMLLRELVDHAVEQGDLSIKDGVWAWKGLGRADGRLLDLVRMRLGELSAEETELVNMVALAEPLRVDLPAVVELAKAAESLNKRGVLVTASDSDGIHISLAYPLCAEVVVATMPQLTGRRLRRELAAQIARASHRDEDLLRVVRLRLDAGAEVADEELAAAADVALDRQKFVLAEELARRMAPPGEFPHSPRAALRLGNALVGQSRYAEAEEVWSRVGRLPADQEATDYRDLLHARSVNLIWGLRQIDDAVVLLANHQEREDSRLQSARIALYLLADRLHEVAEAGETVLRSNPADHPIAQVTVPPAALASLELGDAARALRLLLACWDKLDAWEAEPRLFHSIMTVTAAFLNGRLELVNEVLARLTAEPGPVVGQRQQLVMNARLSRAHGRHDAAAAMFRQAAALRDSREWLTTQSWTLAQLAGCLAEGGYFAEAVRVFAEARSAERTALAFPIAVDGMTLEGALIDAHLGDTARARAKCRELAERCAQSCRPAGELNALYLLARLGDARLVTDRASALAASAASRMMSLQATHIEALAANDPGRLAAVSADLLAGGLLPLAIESAAQAYRAYRIGGRRRHHQAVAAQCRQLLATHRDRIPPWMREDASPAPALTRREHEIAALAAVGQSNREIADRLTVSIRTVENHLQRAYSKLGVARRTELAERLAAVH
ncbi:LuxR C-terminal-related transcriptional regulator [Solwaraspora sp. WMMB335]|uniref:helix-turn-helix transcriptional regulator n=1 Tax=Solwaraspora sp. WMMB335 TaxID=3404118 RepID=UPI003B926FA2